MPPATYTAGLYLFCSAARAVAHGGGGAALDKPAWVHGALVPSLASYSSVCSTANGCTPGAFLSCADASQRIIDITFASYGNPTECPAPMLGSCSHPDSMKVAKAACLGKTNCTVPKRAFKSLGCSSQIESGFDNVIVAAQCSGGVERRANLLRYAFALDGEVLSAHAMVSALGYQVLYCNGRRVSQRVMEPGRTSATRVFFSRFDLAPYLREGSNVLAVSLGNGWEVNAGNQPGAIQQPPALYLDANISLKTGPTVRAEGENSSGSGSGGPMTVRIVSNGSWSSGGGVVTYDSVYQGERRDMRLQELGWASTDFNATGWQPAIVGAGTDKQLTEQTRPGVIELMALQPRWLVPINISIDPSHRPHSPLEPSCGEVEEDEPLSISCLNSTIKGVVFAQYGTPLGACSGAGGGKNLQPGKCARDLTPALTAACVGKTSCTVECRSCGVDGCSDSAAAAGPMESAVESAPPPCKNSCSVNGETIVPSGDPCEGTKKTVVVAVSCVGTPPPPPPPPPRKQQRAYLVDFGQNIGGVIRLKPPLHPTDGQTITVRHCEVLQHAPLVDDIPAGGERGCFYGELVNALNTDVYTLSSNTQLNGAWLQPEFTIHGFRYAEITGLDGLSSDAIEAVVIGANISHGGGNSSSLRIGHPLLQKIQSATVWSQRSNTQDIVTDCNQRDERLGWMGDAAISAEEASYNFPGVGGIAGTHAQFVQMIADGQGDDGAVSDITPTVWQLGAMQPADPSWGSAFPTIAHQVWMTTGSTQIIQSHLSHLVAYLNSLDAGVKHSGGLAHIHTKYGDWFPPGIDGNGAAGTRPLVSASAFIHDAKLVSEMAGAVGQHGVQQQFLALHDSLAAEFNKAWLRKNGSSYSYASGCQTDLAVPLWLGIVPAEARATVVEALVKDIQAHGFHTTSGILGTRAQYEALSLNGRTDIALAMLNRTSYPSYGFMVENPLEPSTTLWEKWGASNLTKDQGDSSRNHVMFGSISAWFWKYLAGITPKASGWRALRVAPSFGELCGGAVETDVTPANTQLDTVAATLATVTGVVQTAWQLELATGVATLNVSVPVAADVVLPCVSDDSEIIELISGAVVFGERPFSVLSSEARRAGVYSSARDEEGGGVRLELGSGVYSFRRQRKAQAV